MSHPHAAMVACAVILTATLTAAAPADRCDPLARVDRAAPVYTLLFGYPYATGRPLPRLEMVGHDLRQMARFFAALGPDRRWVHAEADPGLRAAFGSERRPPTWRALTASVGEMVAALDGGGHAGRAQVYLYFVGHGGRRRGGVAPGEIYAAPDPGRRGPGHDGRIGARLFAERVLRPLAARADVHLIVDACQSFWMLPAPASRALGRAKRPVDAERLTAPFAARLPTVGALLATDGHADATWEDGRLGGIYSHALRSAAIGPADVDRDGVVTYGEMHRVVDWILAGSGSGIRPATVPPGLDPDAPFIDWRRAPAARVCVVPDLPQRQLMGTPAGVFATLDAPPGPHRLHLARGLGYRFDGPGRAPFEFLARDGTLDASGRPDPAARSRSYVVPFDRPLVPALLGDPPAAPPFVPGRYGGLAVVGHGGGMVVALPDAEFGLDLRGRVGRGLSRALVEVGLSRRDHDRRIAGEARAVHPAFGVLAMRAGYARLVAHTGGEVDVGVLGGFAWALSRRWPSGWLTDVALHVGALWPFGEGSRWSARADLRAGALLLAPDLFEPFVQLGVGVDFEVFLE